LPGNQVVYRQGDTADAVFYIQIGKAKVIVTSEQGKEAVVGFLGIGDFFGEGCLGGQALRLATVAALTECEITRIPKAEMVSVIHDEPAFAELFMAYLLARNGRMEADLVDQVFNSARNAWHGPSCFSRNARQQTILFAKSSSELRPL